jgi:hypothetical protein
VTFDTTSGWSEADSSADLPPDVPPIGADSGIDVPQHLDTLPDGRETLVSGDVDVLADFNHQQGDNPYGFQGTCGICSCQDVLNQFGTDVSEADVVDHAVAAHECAITDDPTFSGGTTEQDQVQILADYGIPAHAEHARSLEDLAADVEQGRGVIAGVNAGVVWNDPNYFENGQANHAVVVTGVARDPATGEIQGFYVNDSGDGSSGEFVDAAAMTDGWLAAGGGAVVTDVARPIGPDRSEPRPAATAS